MTRTPSNHVGCDGGGPSPTFTQNGGKSDFQGAKNAMLLTLRGSLYNKVMLLRVYNVIIMGYDHVTEPHKQRELMGRARAILKDSLNILEIPEELSWVLLPSRPTNQTGRACVSERSERQAVRPIRNMRGIIDVM